MNNKLVIGLAPFEEDDSLSVLDAYAFNVLHDKPTIEFLTYDKNFNIGKLDSGIPRKFFKPLSVLRYIDIVHVDKEESEFQRWRNQDIDEHMSYRQAEFRMLGVKNYYNPFSKQKKEDRIRIYGPERKALYSTLAIPATGITSGLITASLAGGIAGGLVAAAVAEYRRNASQTELEKELGQLENVKDAFRRLWTNVKKAEVNVIYRSDIADFVKDARSQKLDIPAWLQTENKVAYMYGYDKFVKGVFEDFVAKNQK